MSDGTRWITLSSDVADALEELKAGGDRAAAIVAATLVEEHLTGAIKACLHRDQKISKDLFRVSGPLGAFGTKINIAFLIGLFGAESHRELVTIKDVRNLFAHNLRLKGFATPRVKDLVNSLVKHERSFTVEREGGKGRLPLKFAYRPDPDPPTDARERFIRSCKYYTAVLAAETRNYPTMPQPFF